MERDARVKPEHDDVGIVTTKTVILGLAPRIHFPLREVMARQNRWMDPRRKAEGDGHFLNEP